MFILAKCSQSSISIPPSVINFLKKQAELLGVPIEDIVLERLLVDLDPEDKAKEYISVASSLLEQAKIELKRGDLRQASEKIWDAIALSVKAFAYKHDKLRLSSHGELWEYKDKLVKVFGEWVRECWNAGVHMHVNFYEGWATKSDIIDAIKKAERLVEAIRSKILTKTEEDST